MSAASVPADPATLDALKWRCIGPPRGGRVVAVAGDANNPMVFYFGACAGGIWKTTDGGLYWRNVSDGFLTSSSVGAIAVARSNSNVVYAGMGETTIRLDVSYGDGVYKSTDAGRTWSHVGLRQSRHIGRVCIHPTNPDLVYVAVLGDIFGPNEERGVYRSKDGGKTWERVLYRNADSGAVDMSMDPNNPRILFATIWETRRNFWNISSGGPGSGLFRSMDGGDTWEEISRNPGLPDGMLGKIGVAISPARSGRVWALIETTGEKTGLYRSEDFGASWKLTSTHRDLMHRPWYYTHVFADTGHADTVFVTNLQMWKSTDGGTSFSEITTPHGDNHDLWIDPVDPNRMVEGNDGGANVSFNGGDTWSSIYNQLTAQFYRIDTDNRYPYRVYGTQQDNTSISAPSAAEWGAITLGDCIYPGTGESGFIAVKPDDPDIVYCGAVGSSPGGAGALQRYDHRTRQMQLVNVWPEESTGIAPKDLKYRFAWTFPIVFSPHNSGVIYAGGNCVFRTRDEGMSWQAISPDLSLNDVSRQGASGGPITRESAGAEIHATCASVVESPHRQGEIWASTDDGLVHVTRDDGATWSNVTPKDMPPLAYVGCVEISRHDPDTIYVAATRYKLADYRPHLFRSRDGGRSWTSIVGNFPSDEISRVVRADPVRPDLLFVGTETGVFYSLDDGEHWSRMSGGLPVVPVYDLKIKDSDLVAGTHGRSFWILDDITPLREISVERSATRIFTPRTTVRQKLTFSALAGLRLGTGYQLSFGIGGAILSSDKADGTRAREYLDVGENPPPGAIVYYWLADAADAPVTITIRDEAGATVASFRSDDQALGVARRPTVKRELNRFIWDLKHSGPTKLDPALAPARNKPLSVEPEGVAGPAAVPGKYMVEMVAGGQNRAAFFAVAKDPRLSTADEAFARQYDLHRQLVDCLDRLHVGVNRIRRIRRQIGDITGRAGSLPDGFGLSAKSLADGLAAIEGILIDVNRQSVRDVLRNPAGLNDTLQDMINMVILADAAPTTQTVAVSNETMTRVDGELAKLEALIKGELAALNGTISQSAAYAIG